MPSKLIEKNFPIKEISQLAIPERSSYRPIYQISKWFARRSSSIFRAIIFGSILSSSDDLMENFYKDHNFKDITLLDPFVGGGTTCIEGLRLGIRCIGCDINPIAWFITKTEAEVINLNLLEDYITECENELKLKIKKMYQTECPHCREEADIIYVHWVKKIACKHCGKDIALFRNYVIGKILEKYYLLCPDCWTVFESKVIPEETTCPSCNNDFKPKEGNRVGRTTVKCHNCHSSFLIRDSIKKLDNPLKADMFAIEGYCHKCIAERKGNSKVQGRRFFKRPDKKDQMRFNKSKEEWYNKFSELPWPKEKIPNGNVTQVLRNHNYSYWYELFNERQLLALSMILDYIRKIKDQQVQEMLLAAFINLLNHNNTFTRYSMGGQKVEGIFARHDYHPLSSYAENNVWGTKYGRGTWVKCLKRLMEGKKYNLAPYSFSYKDNKSTKVFSGQIEGKTTIEPEEFIASTDHNLLLLCKDSAEISSQIGQVDLIITDPPYADNVNYSELSDFFYVWVRIVLRNKYLWFDDIETPKHNEAIVSRKRKLDFYEKLMDIFKRTKSFLKDEGLFIFTFHHSNHLVWKKMSTVLWNSGLKVIKTHAFPSEAKNVLNIHQKKAISFDLIIICKKDDVQPRRKINIDQFFRELHSSYHVKMKDLKKANIEVEGYDHLAVYFGCLLELEFKYEMITQEGEKLSHEELWDLAIEKLP
ncbi:MAG: hypothetical protein ACTSR2_08070 [Candidatus Hodarchaeales archaeon]